MKLYELIGLLAEHAKTCGSDAEVRATGEFSVNGEGNIKSITAIKRVIRTVQQINDDAPSEIVVNESVVTLHTDLWGD